ncbi:MAG: PAS domain-containing protein [Bdellovibrionota bacterium]
MSEIYDYRILDTEDEATFDQITKLAASICGTPIALVSLLDTKRQWFKSRYGLDAKETPRDISFCTHAVKGNDLFIVPDAWIDPRFQDNPLVKGSPHVRFYAGAPLKTPSGENIGTLCVIDSVPREMTDQQKEILESLSRHVVDLLELRKKSAEIGAYVKIFEQSVDAVMTLSPPNWNFTSANPATLNLFHVASALEFSKLGPWNISPATQPDGEISAVKAKMMIEMAMREGSSYFEWEHMRLDGSTFPSTVLFSRIDHGKVSYLQATVRDNTEKKKADELLEKSRRELLFTNKLLEVSLEGSDAVIWDWNLKDKVSFDRRWNKLLGIPLEETNYHPRQWLSRVHPDDFKICQTVFYDYVQDKRKSFECAYRLRHNDGTWVWVLSRGKFSDYDDSGRPQRFSGTLVDITTQKNLENQLTEAQEIAKVGSWKFDLFSNDLVWSKEHFNIFEISHDCPKEELFAAFRSRVHPDDMTEVEKGMSEVIEHGGEFIHEYRIILDNGQRVKHIQGRGRIVSDELGAPLYLTGTCRDRTSDVENAEKYHSLLEENRFILDSLGIGVWIADVKSGEQIWDETMHRLYETDPLTYSPTFQGWMSFLSEDSVRFITQESGSMQSGNLTKLDHTLEIKTQKGQKRFLSTRGHIVRNMNNEVTKIFGINWDSTKSMELEKTLESERMRSLHNAKLASIGELAAGVGHEINNPLAIIATLICITDQLVEMHAPPEEIREKLAKMDISVNRISKIVKGLRTFARSDDEEVTLFDPFSMIRETSDFLNEIYLRENIRLELELEPSEIQIRGNRGRLQQVLINLLSNARDATEKNSSRELMVRAQVAGGELVISVQDNGCGIPEAIREKIFDPFFTTKDVNQGTGIGLSLVNTIVKEHSGKIEMSSEIGAGTEFRICLPLWETIRPKNSVVKAKKIKSKISGRVLFVDDEPHLRELMREVLLHSFEEVETAGSVNEALAILKVKSFDSVVSDIRMPIKDGFYLLKSIRMNPVTKNLPFIFLTGGNEMTAEEERIVDTQSQGLFYKPVKIPELIQRLSEISLVKANVG